MTAPIPTPAANRYGSIYVLLRGWLVDVLGYPNVTRRVPTNLVFSMPLVVVDRIGGADTVPTIDFATVDIDTYAAGLDEAEAHALHIWTQLRTRLVNYNNGSVRVTYVETVTAPVELPWDSRTQVVRYGGTYRIKTHQYTGI